MKNQFNPDYRVAPSETIKECISCFLESNTNSNLTMEEWEDLISNELQIDERIAEELEKVFKVSKQFWLNLQKNYDK